MNKWIKAMYALLGLAFLFIISPALAEGSCEGLDMFDMKCCIERGIAVPEGLRTNSEIVYFVQSGTIYQKTSTENVEINSGSENFWYFNMLFGRRFYQNINLVDELFINGQKYTIALGQKCNHPEVRINGKEYRNDLGIFDVKVDSDALRLYYYQNGGLNALKCTPKAVDSSESPASSDGASLVVSTGTSTSIIQNITTTPVVQPGIVIPDPGQAIKINPIIIDNIQTYSQLNQETLYELVKKWGMNRKTDRKALAEQVGIDLESYKGTKAQNLIIRDYLLKKISVNIQATDTRDITLPAQRFEKVQKIELWRIVGLRSYVWQKDRFSIAKEFGYEPQIYLGTKAQNLKIRAWLLDKIHKQQ